MNDLILFYFVTNIVATVFLFGFITEGNQDRVQLFFKNFFNFQIFIYGQPHVVLTYFQMTAMVGYSLKH